MQNKDCRGSFRLRWKSALMLIVMMVDIFALHLLNIVYILREVIEAWLFGHAILLYRKSFRNPYATKIPCFINV